MRLLLDAHAVNLIGERSHMTAMSLSLVVLKSLQIDPLKSFYRTLGIDFVEEQHGKGPIHFSAQIGDTLPERVFAVKSPGTEF